MGDATTFYIEADGASVYALFDEAAGSDSGTAVLIVGPWGWDAAASYRSLRGWAKRLADAGHPTLRIDLPGTGDSGGMPLDDGLVESWVGAVEAGAAWLRGRVDGGRVALLGIGLGGLLARAALRRGRLADELVLWGAPDDARSFWRTQRAFTAMQSWVGDPAADAPLPEGAFEAGGFVVSAATKAALAALVLDPKPDFALQRALLLDRDGIAPGAEVRAGLEGVGTAVTVAPGPGFGVLVSDPEGSRLDESVAATVADWLAAGPTEAAPPTSAAPPGAVAILDLGAVRERAWTMEQDFGRLYGVLAEPAAGPASGTCAVFFNAGAIRNVGPNRMWTETARRWAARGMNVLRVDLDAIGESDGDETRFADVAEFYVPTYADQVALLLDELRRQGLGRRFLLAGLCAGAYWSFVAAQDRPDVARILLLNPAALVWDAALVNERQFRQLARLLSLGWWRKLLSGGVRRDGWKILLGILAGRARQVVARLRGRLSGRGGDPVFDIEAALDRVRDNGVGVSLAFSGEEALRSELDAAGVLGELDSWPNVELSALPFSDHSLRPIAAQVAAREVIDRELERF